MKTEDLAYKVAFEGDTPSCKSGERKSSSTVIIHDGMMVVSGVDEDGNAYTNPPEPASPSETGRDAVFTEHKPVDRRIFDTSNRRIP